MNRLINLPNCRICNDTGFVTARDEKGRCFAAACTCTKGDDKVYYNERTNRCIPRYTAVMPEIKVATIKCSKCEKEIKTKFYYQSNQLEKLCDECHNKTYTQTEF